MEVPVAKVLQKGEIFKTADGYGIALGKRKALVIKGQGGRIERKVDVEEITAGIVPITEDELKRIDYEVQFALKVVRTSLDT